MSSTATRLAALAAVAAMGIAAPVTGAGAATTPAPAARLAFPGFPATAFPATGFPVAGFPLTTGVPDVVPGLYGAVGPVGEAGAVVGPVIITTAPSVFVNTNNQVTAGGAVSGGQVAG